MALPHRISDRGREFIKQWEGLRLNRYLCSAGRPTIGWGHLLEDDSPVKKITLRQAETYFDDDIRDVEVALDSLVQVPLTIGQVDALGSWIFNLGRTRFSGSTLLKKLNKKDYLGARAEFPRWVYVRNPKTGGMEVSEGLRRRRLAEVKLWG